MAKYKAASKSKNKPAAAPTRGLIPCAILVLGGILVFSLFFYAFIKSASS